MIFSHTFCQTFKEEITPILDKRPEWDTGWNIAQIVSWGHRHPDTKTRQNQHNKENYRPISLMNADTKILIQVLAHQIGNNLKGRYVVTKRCLPQKYENGLMFEEPSHLNPCINRIKTKTTWHCLINAEKYLTKLNTHSWCQLSPNQKLKGYWTSIKAIPLFCWLFIHLLKSFWAGLGRSWAHKGEWHQVTLRIPF